MCVLSVYLGNQTCLSYREIMIFIYMKITNDEFLQFILYHLSIFTSACGTHVDSTVSMVVVHLSTVRIEFLGSNMEAQGLSVPPVLLFWWCFNYL